MLVYDYVVAGAGSAGCVIANRLVRAGKSVLLLESGPRDNHPFVHIPATFVRVIGSRRSWMYKTEPETGAGGRILTIPQGRTLGGGSSINALIYIRGQAQDYDTWRDLGCTGWGYDDVLPVFRRSEGNERLANTYHDTHGMLRVSDLRYRHPLSYAFVRAAQESGLSYNDDFNGAHQEGIGFYQTTIFDGRRGSTAATYLKRIKGNPLLTLKTNCDVTGLVFENEAVAGIRYRTHAGAMHTATVREEVILAAGTIGTPKILMLSGIGPSTELARHHITPVRHLPGVGENFQDHIAASVYGVTDQAISLRGQDQGLKAIKNGLQYLMTRTGLLTSNVVESGGFIDTTGSGRPDVQIHVTPSLVGDAERTPMPGHGISITPCLLRPVSRGSIRLRSASPFDAPMIHAATLAAPEDAATLVRGIKLARRILAAPALRVLGFSELAPSRQEDISDEALEAYARRAAKTVYHPSGTCKMGRDEMAVVDEELRVIGVPRLRVADASIMPTLISGNTNAACVMIGERCADFILREN